MKILTYMFSIVIFSLFVFNAYAENKINKLPTLNNDVKGIDKPVSKSIKPFKNKINKEKLYTYTAIFAGPFKKSRVTSVNNIKWNCKKSKTCTTMGSWPSPRVQTCHQLAISKAQKITSYGHLTDKLSISQLSQCNRGVKNTPSGLALNKSKVPSGFNKKDKQAANTTTAKKQLIQNNKSNKQSLFKTQPLGSQSNTVKGQSISSKSTDVANTNKNNVFIKTNTLNKDITVKNDAVAGDIVKNNSVSGGLLTSNNKLQGRVNTDRETELSTSQQLEITMNTDKFEKLKAELEIRAEAARRKAIENERIRATEAKRAESVAAVGYYGVGFNNGNDCDDVTPSTYPGATEVCDGVDNNCNGTVDEGVSQKYYLDADGDLHGNLDSWFFACSADALLGTRGVWLSPVGNDCDDTDPDRWHDCEE